MMSIRLVRPHSPQAAQDKSKSDFGECAEVLPLHLRRLMSESKTFKQHPLPDPEKFFDVPGATPDTYGGNTSCVEVRHNEKIIILDMGTGLRPFGNSVYAEMIKQGGLDTIFLVSHVHWDHIQGFPFYGEIHVNKNLNPKIFNKWKFVGGTGWQKTAEECLRKQMEAPNFPFSFDEIEKITGKLAFDDMVDGKELQIDDTTCRVRRLDHPQETYGSRLEFPGGRVVVYTTDNEPRDPLFPAEPLLWLAKGANIWITDCQYTKNQYEGKDPGGVRHGWGHSYPEAVAKTAVIAG